MKKTGALVAAITILVPGCSALDRGGRADRASRETTTATSGGQATMARSAAIYAAVTRRLVTKDHTFGRSPSPFKRIYIVDGVVAEAADPGIPREPRRPFVVAVKDGIARQLADLREVQFVSDPEAVIEGQKCPRAEGDGVLVSLGPISGTGRRVTVANGVFFSCLGGQWLTYVLERVDGDWRVVGTKGAVAVS
jgi:hypothetical protein